MIGGLNMGRAINRRRGAGGGGIDYRRQYLTITALEEGAVGFYLADDNWEHGISTDYVTSVSYSTDGGRTWTTRQNTGDAIIFEQHLYEGQQILVKGIANSYYDGTILGHFETGMPCSASGNIMSLLYGDNFIGQTALPNYTYTFYKMFYYRTTLSDISNLVMPATTLRSHCYDRMFSGTSITSLPEGLLPATTLAESCYYYMFYECPITEIPSRFLPATTLATGCYYGMFEYAQITTLPSGLLPASTLADSCYREMFYSCTSLVTVASDLMGATTLASACCRGMFSACPALTTPPDLNAATLVTECYRVMFYNCSSLNYVKCLATNISASNATYSWLTGRKDGGTFYAKPGASWSSNNSGIPTTWTRVNV